MRVNFTEFSTAVDMVTKALSGNASGILVTVGDETAVVCGDNRTACYKAVDIRFNDEAEKAVGNIIIDYAMLDDALKKMSSSGSIKVDDLVIDTTNIDNKIVTLEASKYVNVQNGDDIFKQITTTMKEDIRAFKASNESDVDSKYRTVTRFDYNTRIFGSDTSDTWNRKDLITVIKKLSGGEDGKLAYLMRQHKVGMTVNKSSVFVFNCKDGLENYSVSMTGKMGKNICDVLSKVSEDTVQVVNSDGAYCSMYTEDHKFGLWFMMAQYRNTDGEKWAMYKNSDPETLRQYDYISVLLNREVMLDMIKSYKYKNKLDSSQIKFNFVDDDARRSLKRVITDEDNNTTEEFVDATGNVAIQIGNKKNEMVKVFAPARRSEGSAECIDLVMTFPVWEEILNACESTYVRFGMHKVDDRIFYLKFDDLSETEVGEDGKPVAIAEVYTTATSKSE